MQSLIAISQKWRLNVSRAPKIYEQSSPNLVFVYFGINQNDTLMIFRGLDFQNFIT